MEDAYSCNSALAEAYTLGFDKTQPRAILNVNSEAYVKYKDKKAYEIICCIYII
jgi:hypothetical protein